MAGTMDPGQRGDPAGQPAFSPTDTTPGRMANLGDNWWLSLVPELEGFIREWSDRLSDPNFIRDPVAAQNAFIGALQGTAWWGRSNEVWREAEQQRLTDPGTWSEQISVNRGDIERYATAMGYSLSSDDLDSLSLNLAYGDWTEAQIEREVLAKTYYSNQETSRPTTGSIKGLYDAIKDMSKKNLISVSDEWAWRMAHDVKAERNTLETVGQTIYDLTKAEYSFIDPSKIDSWANAGLTVSDALDPVLQSVKAAWEVEDIDFTDDWFNDNLVITEDNGTQRFATSKEATKLAHQDERYLGTSQHRNNMTQFTSGLAQMFGVR